MTTKVKNRRKKPKKAKVRAYPEAVFTPLQLKMIKQVIQEEIEAEWSRWIAEAVERRIVKHTKPLRRPGLLDPLTLGSLAVGYLAKSKRGGPPVIGGALI